MVNLVRFRSQGLTRLLLKKQGWTTEQLEKSGIDPLSVLLTNVNISDVITLVLELDGGDEEEY